MEQFWWIVASGVGMLVLGAGIVWRFHRIRMAKVRRKLAWSEETRFAAERKAASADARLAELTRKTAPKPPPRPAAAPAPRKPTRPVPVLSVPISSPSGMAVQWADTEPVAVELDAFKPTQPFEPTR